MLSSAHMLPKVRHQYKQSAATTNSIKRKSRSAMCSCSRQYYVCQVCSNDTRIRKGNLSVARFQGVLKTEAYQKRKGFLVFVAQRVSAIFQMWCDTDSKTKTSETIRTVSTF